MSTTASLPNFNADSTETEIDQCRCQFEGFYRERAFIIALLGMSVTAASLYCKDTKWQMNAEGEILNVKDAINYKQRFWEPVITYEQNNTYLDIAISFITCLLLFVAVAAPHKQSSSIVLPFIALQVIDIFKEFVAMFINTSIILTNTNQHTALVYLYAFTSCVIIRIACLAGVIEFYDVLNKQEKENLKKTHKIFEEKNS